LAVSRWPERLTCTQLPQRECFGNAYDSTNKPQQNKKLLIKIIIIQMR